MCDTNGAIERSGLCAGFDPVPYSSDGAVDSSDLHVISAASRVKRFRTSQQPIFF